MLRHNEGWRPHIHRECKDCGARIIHDLSVAADHVFYNPNRATLLQGMKNGTVQAKRKANFSCFPVGVYNKITAGVELRTTHRAGGTQRRRILSTFNSARAFFRLEIVATGQSVGRTGDMSYVNKYGDIMVITPPVMLTHKTKNQGSAAITESLVVMYNVAMVNPRTGRVNFAIDHPVEPKEWGVPAHNFDAQWSVQWHAIEAALQISTTRAHPLTPETVTVLRGERARLWDLYEARRLAAMDPTLRIVQERMQTRAAARAEPPEEPEGERVVILPEEEEAPSSDEGDPNYDVMADLDEQ